MSVLPPATTAALRSWLDGQGLGAGPVYARPIGNGHSNLTYAISRGSLAMVLRRPPAGHLAESTHDVLREAAWLAVLEQQDVPVPRVLAACADPEVLGVPFYVMEHVRGFVPGGESTPPLDWRAAGPPMARSFVDALVALHAIDVERTPALRDFRRPGTYVDRQLRRFTGLWEEHRWRDIPEIDEVTTWLVAHRPVVSSTSIVHGDARLGNAMFAGSPPRLVAMLDWELAALGDPLADLGYLLATWAQADDRDTDPILELSTLTREPGFPSREELRAYYAAASGRAIRDLRFFEVLALWKAAIFLEGSYRRFVRGDNADGFVAGYDSGVPAVARRALRTALDDHSADDPPPRTHTR